ncbi:SDR family NAD(P)-dependent oxidoreductase, partial [bacterium]
ISKGESLAKIKAHKDIRIEQNQFSIHPTILDSAFQIIVSFFLEMNEKRMYVPVCLGKIKLYKKTINSIYWSYADIVKETDREIVYNIFLYDNSGNTVLIAENVIMRDIGSKNSANAKEILYNYEWEKFNLKADKKVSKTHLNPQKHWLIFDRGDDIGKYILQRIKNRKDNCYIVKKGTAYKEISNNTFIIDPDNLDDYKKLYETLSSKEISINKLLYLWPANPAITNANFYTNFEQSGYFGIMHLINLFKVFGVLGQNQYLKFYLVTKSLYNIEHSMTKNNCISQAPLLGLGRVIMNEYPYIKTTLIDIEKSLSVVDMKAFTKLVFDDDIKEEEIAIRSGIYYSNKLNLLNMSKSSETEKYDIESGCSYAVLAPNHLNSNNLNIYKTVLPDLKNDEIKIKVHSTGINIRDKILINTSISERISKNGFFKNNFGMECSGEIIEKGKDVKRINIGDKVIAIARASLASHTIAKEWLTIKKPNYISFSCASILPIPYLTAYYVVYHLFKISKSDTILINLNDISLSNAFINIFKILKSKIVIITRTKEEKEFLNSNFNSNSINVINADSFEYREKVMDLTSGKGADIIFNDYRDEHIIQTIKCLAQCGKFVQLGDSDLYADFNINMDFLKNNISYYIFDIDKFIYTKKNTIKDILPKALKFAFNKNITQTAFKELSIKKMNDIFKSNEYEKIVIKHNNNNLMLKPSLELKFLPNAAYLIAGGTGGLGLFTASWMIANGARNIVLFSRNGIKTKKDQKIIDKLRQSGIKIIIKKGDITYFKDVKLVIKYINDNLPQLKGVIHSAMVIDDMLIQDLTKDRIKRVVDSKINGSWNLHRATLGLNLDYFVLFSSLASIIGNPSQANYVAGNCFLDMLSFYRKTKGLPCITINWGPIGDVGYLTKKKKLKNILESFGFNLLTKEKISSYLNSIFLNTPTQAIAADLDWPKMNNFILNNDRSLRFNRFINTNTKKDYNVNKYLKNIIELSNKEALLQLEKALKIFIGTLLGLSEEKLDKNLELTYMGVDSLMANQIRNWIYENLAVQCPVMKIMEGITISELTEFLYIALLNASKSDEKSDLSNNWIMSCKKIKDPKMRIFCFPHLGIGASLYEEWQNIIGNDIEVCAIQFPGRELRAGEKPITNLGVLNQELAKNILHLLDRPFAFYGHCIGSNIAFDFSYYLERVYDIKPKYIFIGGSMPHYQDNPLANHFKDHNHDYKSIVNKNFKNILSIDELKINITDNDIINIFKKVGFPNSLVSNELWINTIREFVKADIIIGKTLRYSQIRVIESPIVVF